LRDGQLLAGAANRLSHRARVQELKSIAEGCSLPNYGQDFHISEGENEFQAHDLSHRYFHEQHGGDAGFAYVHGVSANDGRAPRVDADFDVQRVSGGSALFDEFARCSGSELALHSQFCSPERPRAAPRCRN